MSLTIQQSDWFWADLQKQVGWYREEAGLEVALRCVSWMLEATLQSLGRQPGQGRLRFKSWMELADIRSFRVERPFQRMLIFYRHNMETIFAERLIHGVRDLPAQLRLYTPFS